MSESSLITPRVIAVGIIRRTGLSAHIANCCIELDHGDITQESTRAIVNSVCGGSTLGGGECNTAIVKAAGPSLGIDYNTSTPGNHGIVSTRAGNLRQDKIYHVVATNDVNALKSLVGRTLKKADSDEMNSIAFPALGTGHMGGDAKKLAVPMFEGMKEFALEDQPLVLHTIKLVIYNAELFDLYKEAMQETLVGYCKE